MSCSNKGLGGPPERARLKTILSLLLVAMLLIQVQRTQATIQTNSGTVELGNTLEYGTTAYSVAYSFPSTVAVGTNLTIALTLNVDSLTGLVEYIIHPQLNAKVFIGANVLTSIVSLSNSSRTLYPGSSWGPNNVTIPLTAQSTGLAVGASDNATVSVTLEDEVYYGGGGVFQGGLNTFGTEPPMEGAAGSVLVQNLAATSSSTTSGANTGQTQTVLPYTLLASGVVLMLVVVVIRRWPQSSQPRKKQQVP
jgi:hypothetical protein